MKLKYYVYHLPDECHKIVTRSTLTGRQLSRNRNKARPLLREECHKFVTRFFNNGHPIPGAFSSDRLEYKRSNFEQILRISGTYCYLLFLKKVMRNNKINSTDKIYDVNCLFIQY